MFRTVKLILIASIFIIAASATIASAQIVFETVGLVGDVSYEDLFGSARQSALGNADLGSNAGAEHLLINPGAPLLSGDGVDVEVAWTNDFAPFMDGEFTLSALSVEARHRRLRFGLASWSYLLDGVPVRTAFEPEGVSIDVARREIALAVSADLGGLLLDHERWTWVFGVSVNRTSVEIGTDETSTNALDLGSTIGWGGAGEGVAWTVRGAAVVTNALGADEEFGTRARSLPRLLRAGITGGVTFTAPEAARDPLAITLAIAGSIDLDAGDDAPHLGGEVVLFELLALRGGHDGFVYDGIDAFGIGLRTEIGPIAAAGIDWTRQWAETDAGDAELDIWGARVGARF